METDVLINCQDLRFAYPQSDFELVVPSLQIKRGEKVAIIGPSGSGKTTLIQLFAGILAADSGQLLFDGKEIVGRSDVARRRHRLSSVGHIFQNFELIEYLTLRDNIRLNTLLAPASAQNESAQSLDALAKTCGIDHRLNYFPHQLSQGEQQRGAICRALLHHPPLLLADEPTGNLDRRNTDAVLELILSQVSENNQTLILVTHDARLLERVDRVIDFETFLTPQSI